MEYDGSGSSRREADVERFRSEFERLGGTPGFLREEDSEPSWQQNLSEDAFVLSLHNAME